MRQMNGSRVARVDGDEYDWSDYTTGAKQDEYLISPKVNLAGKTPTLKFDYGFGRYALFAGGIRLTVEASVDGGATLERDLERQGIAGECVRLLPDRYLCIAHSRRLLRRWGAVCFPFL